MLIPFESQPAQARLWIYQSHRDLSPDEAILITQTLESKANSWEAHGADLRASVQVLHGRFVAIALDESLNAASGCSIDASTHWLKELGATLNVDFFDRSIIAQSPLGTLQAIEPTKAKQAVASGIIEPESLIFNTLVPNLMAFRTQWQTPAKESWLGRYF